MTLYIPLEIDSIIFNNFPEQIVVASCLYDKGLLVTGDPLDCNDSDSESSDAECEYFEEEDDDDEDVNEENAELVHSYDNGAEFSDDEDDEDDENDDDDDLYSAVCKYSFVLLICAKLVQIFFHFKKSF